MSVEQSLVLTEINAGVARLTLNRPQQYNALSSAMLAALHEALDSVAANAAVRVIIIAAGGKAFCEKFVPMMMRLGIALCLIGAQR
jgi:enoyl-CoA hydratase/carnithine racemase